MENSAAITGIGMITSLGTNVRETVNAWNSGIEMTTHKIPELSGTGLADFRIAELPDFDPAARLAKPRMAKFMSAPALLGCVAAHEALDKARAAERFAPERIGLFAATGMAAADIDESIEMLKESLDEEGSFSIRRFGEKGLHSINPLLSFKILANMPGCLVSVIENIKGPSYIFTPWEDQAAAAIIEAIDALNSREIDCAVVTASDIASHPANLVHLASEGFIKDNEVAAPGAGCLVLEREETAAETGRNCPRISRLSLSNKNWKLHDPLAVKIGRTIAPAPLIMLGLAASGIKIDIEIGGCGGETFSCEVLL